MKAKLAVVFSTVLLASLAIVSTASAYTSSLTVLWDYKISGLCRPAPDQVRLSLEYFVKIKRKHSPKPKSVTVRYGIADAATGTSILKGKLSLTARNKWRKATPAFIATAGQALVYETKLSYKGPLTGKTVRSNGTDSDKVPSVEEMDAANAANPTAPPFPACV
jgi:hypothetical protein